MEGIEVKKVCYTNLELIELKKNQFLSLYSFNSSNFNLSIPLSVAIFLSEHDET